MAKLYFIAPSAPDPTIGGDMAKGGPLTPAELDQNFANLRGGLAAALAGYVTKGEWNAATNVPTIPAAAVANNGHRYIVTVAGTTSIDGISAWSVGDNICSNGTAWFRLPAAVSLTPSQGAELSGGGNSVLHYHATDRDRSNHTGSQAPTTITQDDTHRFVTDVEKATWNGVVHGQTYQGLYNAATDTPATPAASAGNVGWYYRVSVSGNGYFVGDIKISNGTTWERIASADAPAIHGADHLTGGIDPIPAATAISSGLMTAADFSKLAGLNITAIAVQDTPPDNLPIGGIWIDTSTVVRFAPVIASIAPQSWLYASGTTVSILLTDVQDVSGVTLQVISGDTTNLPASALHLSGSGSTRTLTIDALAGAVSTTLTLIATNAYGYTSQISFAAVAASQVFTITTSAGANGAITATATVTQGGSITITATPDSGYGTSQLVIDGGAPVTGVTSWTFSNVSANHTVAASFAVNTAPTISNIADQTTAYQTATSAIAFTVGDDFTMVDNLTVTATSSNQTLIPSASCVIGGSGASRTITCTPATGQSGTSTITVTVSDGSVTASDTFVLTVEARGDVFNSMAIPTDTTYGAVTINNVDFNYRASIVYIPAIDVTVKDFEIKFMTGDSTTHTAANAILMQLCPDSGSGIPTTVGLLGQATGTGLLAQSTIFTAAFSLPTAANLVAGTKYHLYLTIPSGTGMSRYSLVGEDNATDAYPEISMASRRNVEAWVFALTRNPKIRIQG